MIRYILKRVLLIIPVLIGISFIIFCMLEITPGDPAQLMSSIDASEEQIQMLRDELGLNDPFWVRYYRYVRNIVMEGDLGMSYTTRRSVSIELFERFPRSVILAFCSALIAAASGIALGIFSATRQYTVFDTMGTFLGLVGLSMPNFWLGMLLIILFSVQLNWLPASGINSWLCWIMPSLTIGISNCARVMRMTRSSLLEVMRQDYITTARAKGMSEKIVIYKHALGNAAIPIITAIGLAFTGTMGGAIITESVFSIPGIGKLMVDSIAQLNYPMVQGGVLLIAAWVGVVNLLMDIAYAFVDPRIKAQYSRKK